MYEDIFNQIRNEAKKRNLKESTIKRNGDQCINTERQPCFFGGGAFLRFGTGKERRGMLK